MMSRWRWLPTQRRYGVLQEGVGHTERTECGGRGAEPAKNPSACKTAGATETKHNNSRESEATQTRSVTQQTFGHPPPPAASPSQMTHRRRRRQDFFPPSRCARQVCAESFLLLRGDDLSRRSSSRCWGLFFPVEPFDVFTALAKDVKSHGEEN